MEQNGENGKGKKKKNHKPEVGIKIHFNDEDDYQVMEIEKQD